MSWKRKKPFQGPVLPSEATEASCLSSSWRKNAAEDSQKPSRNTLATPKKFQWFGLQSCFGPPAVADEDLSVPVQPANKPGKQEPVQISAVAGSTALEAYPKGHQLCHHSSAHSINAAQSSSRNSRSDLDCDSLVLGTDDVNSSNSNSVNNLVITLSLGKNGNQQPDITAVAKQAKLQEALEQSAKLVRKLTEQKNEANEKHATTQAALSQKDAQIALLTARLQHLEADNGQLQQELLASQAANTKLQNNSYGLNNQLLQLNKRAARHVDRLQQVQTERDSFCQQLQQAREQYRDQVVANAGLQGKYNLLQASHGQLQQASAQLQAEVTELKCELQQKQSRVDLLTQRVADAKVSLLQHHRDNTANHTLIEQLQVEKQQLQSVTDAAHRTSAAQQAEIEQLQDIAVALADSHTAAQTQPTPAGSQQLQAAIKQGARQGKLLYLKGYLPFCQQRRYDPASPNAAAEFLSQAPVEDPNLVYAYAHLATQGVKPLGAGTYGRIYDDGSTVLKVMDMDGIGNISNELAATIGAGDPSCATGGLVRTRTWQVMQYNSKYLMLVRMNKASEGSLWDVLMQMQQMPELYAFERPAWIYRVLCVVYSAADGLRHMHRKNVLHIDIKTTNVLVHVNQGHYQGQLADYSLAELLRLGEEALVDKVVTACYAPAEMPGGKGPISKATDVHMMGEAISETVFLAFTSRGDLSGTKRMDKFAAWKANVAQGLFDEGLPAYVCQLLAFAQQRMMARDPCDRVTMEEAVLVMRQLLTEGVRTINW